MKSYSLKDLQALAVQQGFIRDNLEKVVRLNDILSFLSSSKVTAGKLVLKGGTAINLTVFAMPRLSVDIDLDYNVRTTREGMLAERGLINAEILAFMQSEGYSLGLGSKNPHSLDSWAFSYTNAGRNKDSIKIEINYSMRQHVLEPQYRLPAISFLENTEILALHPLELFASKIKALIERTAARDLYDVANLIHHPVFETFDIDLLRKCVLFYMAVGGNAAPKEECDLTAIDKLQFKQIRAQLLPMLHHSVFFDFQQAKQDVKAFLQDLMVYTDEEKEFIRMFNAKDYCPELLFSDKSIIERISNHPMAVWKTR